MKNFYLLRELLLKRNFEKISYTCYSFLCKNNMAHKLLCRRKMIFKLPLFYAIIMLHYCENCLFF